MAATSLAVLKQKCASTYEVFAAAATRTQQLLAEVELPISKELRGSLLHQLQVEHNAQERYLAARQELFLFVQEQFRRP
jgi:hypothetical protein